MSAAPKMNREPVAPETADKAEIRDDFTGLFLRGMERIAEVQKQWIDIAVQQNAEMIEILKKTAENTPGAVRVPMLDVAQGAVARSADLQKSMVKLFVDESRVWTDVFKDRTSAEKKSTNSTTSFARQTLEHSFAVQKKALDHASAQGKAYVEAAKRQFGFNGTQADALTDTFQKGMDTIVEAQKELLEIVTH